MEDLDTYDSYAVSMEGIARAVLPREVRTTMPRETHLSGGSQLMIEEGSGEGILH